VIFSDQPCAITHQTLYIEDPATHPTTQLTISIIDASRPADGIVPGSDKCIKTTNRSTCNFNSSIGRLFHSRKPVVVYTNSSSFPLTLLLSRMLRTIGDMEERTRRWVYKMYFFNFELWYSLCTNSNVSSDNKSSE